MLQFLKRTDKGLVVGKSLETTVDRYVNVLMNVDEYDGLQMLTSVLNYVFGDMVWSSMLDNTYYLQVLHTN